MKKVLFLVCTPYQLMVVMKIKLKHHKDDYTTILISDSIANAEYLVDTIRKSKNFNNVEIVKFMEQVKCLSVLEFYKHTIEHRLKKQSLFSSVACIKEHYDVIYFSSSTVRYSFLFNQNRFYAKGKSVRYCFFEDGFATYAKHKEFIFSKIYKSKSIKEIIYKMFKYLPRRYMNKIDSIYLFSPNLLEWSPDFKICEIEKIKKNDIEYLGAINEIFNSAHTEDVYEKDFIFFEESYFADGVAVEDEKIVDLMSDIVGKENMLVKIHPRNPVNRFEQKGYITNKNTAVPWEVIAQNIDLNNKILVTIASGSALTTLVNMSIKPKKIIMLMNCKEIDDSKLTPTLETLRSLAEYYNLDIYLPNSLEEFEKYLKDIVKEKKL